MTFCRMDGYLDNIIGMWITLLIFLFGYCHTEYVIEFTARPQPTAVLLGQDLMLNCSAEIRPPVSPTEPVTPSAPPASYQWMYNDLPIETSLPKALIFQNHSLFVPRVTPRELGIYECVVWPSGESASSALGSGAVSVIEAYLEDFLINPHSGSYFESNTTSLECVTGYSAPPALIYWERDGVPFLDGTQIVAQFGSVSAGGASQNSLKLQFVARVEYSGVFRCFAENPLTGEVRKSTAANVDIQSPQMIPYLTENLPSSLLIPEGGEFLLSCPIRGWPIPDITWYQAGRLITKSQHRQVTQNGSLVLSPVMRQDGGMYACIGVNVLGSVATLSTEFVIAYLDISFKQSPTDLTVIAGQRISLPCQPPDSNPPASVLWYKGQEQLVEREGVYAVSIEPTGEVVFDNVQLDDSGEYFCIAHNDQAIPQSRTSPGALLTVEGSPQLVIPPTDLTIVKGDLLTLNCQVKGQPRPSIAWFKDDTLLLPTTRIQIRDFSQEVLIPDVNRLDEGNYRCRCTNVYGVTQSQLAFVDVIVPPEITSVLTDLAVANGDSILLPCSFYGDPPPEVQWYHDDSLLPTTPGSGYISTPEGLLISMATPSDEGTYLCVASNGGGEKNQQAFLDVLVAPSFVAHPVDRTINLSQSVILYCEARGDPRPSVTWKVNDSNVIPVGVEVSDDISTLVIQSAQLYHSGSYTCIAENTLGQATRTGILTVQEKAQVIRIEGQTTVNLGGDLDLRCITDGTPSPSIAWSRNGRELDPRFYPSIAILEGGVRFLLQYADTSDGGVYSCTASNPAGVQSKSVMVLIRDTPLAPFLDSVHSMSMNSVNVSWIPVQQAPQTQLQAYVVQYKLVNIPEFITFREDIPSIATHVEVSDLMPGTEYIFRVAAKNAVGIGGYSRLLTGRTLESAPNKPRNLQLVSHNATALNLQWEIPEQTRGELKLYQVQHREQFSADDFAPVNIEPPNTPLQRHNLSGLTPYTTYIVRVRAANRQGGVVLWGQYTEDLVVTTGMMAPSSPPPGILLTALSSTSIQVRWQEIPAEDQHGALQGYIIYYRLAEAGHTVSQIRMAPVTKEALVTGLLPWRYYEVSMGSYNAAGIGVRSDVVRTRTLPEVPNGAPTDVTVEALSPTQIRVSWQELPVDERRSEISGYLVVYDDINSSNVLSKHVADSSARSTVLIDLTPWTVHSVKVQAFTTQITNGFGPFSIEQRIRTLEDVPGEISNVVVNTDSGSIVLSWQQPSNPNGSIKNYVIYISKLQGTASNGRVRRSLVQFDKDGPATQKFEVSGADTSVTIANLETEKSYIVAMAAKTATGIGQFTNLTVSMAVDSTEGTLFSSDRPEVTSDYSTPFVVSITDNEANFEVATPTANPAASTGNLSRAELIGIIIGAILGGVLVIGLLVLLGAYCCRKRGENDGSYMYTDESQTTIGTSPSEVPPKSRRRPPYFNVQLPEDASSYTTSGTGHTSDSDVQGSPLAMKRTEREKRSSPVTARKPEQQPRIEGQSVTHPQQVKPKQKPNQTVYTIPSPAAHGAFSSESLPPSSILPPLGLGYDNPGYRAENQESSLNPRNHGGEAAAANLAPDTRPSGYVRQSKRMDRKTAAAIAVQKSRETSIFHGIPDTDILLDNTVIVYNERTAL